MISRETTNDAIKCPHCGKWNYHDEIGTYEVLFPICLHCSMCTEVPPGAFDDLEELENDEPDK